jgi:hypothetical protein
MESLVILWFFRMDWISWFFGNWIKRGFSLDQLGIGYFDKTKLKPLAMNVKAFRILE